MREVTILAVGKLRDKGLRKLCDDYYKRCSGRFRPRELELRDRARLESTLAKQRGPLIMLDERGETPSSEAFSKKLRGWLQDPSGPPTFVIGGADGLGDALRGRANSLLSLGKMTFAHRLVRVLLAEQLYRAVSIMDGSPYHRGA